MNVEGPVECVWDMGDAYKILVEKYEGTKPPGILRCGWKNTPNVDESQGYRRSIFP
jgi:hypothetical protein